MRMHADRLCCMYFVVFRLLIGYLTVMENNHRTKVGIDSRHATIQGVTVAKPTLSSPRHPGTRR